ncbi:unnamed protein product [Aphis gossypii]|uniref:Uncharacterized protein n=1 Tax=Aphis gossypii TaxID=80765 RepID=A0A9P0IRA7_APHGO|nr:unnamed protein product [Aphis gossypii]
MHTKPPRRRHVVGRGRKRCRRRRRRAVVVVVSADRFCAVVVIVTILHTYIYMYFIYISCLLTHRHTLACSTVRPIFILYMCVKIINDDKNSIELALRFVVRTRSNQLHPPPPPPPVHLLSRSCIALLSPSPMGR